MTTTHGIRFDGSRFWVVHRRREFGPFDYEWASDLGGIELTYRDHKYGEVCGEAHFHADLREFSLPMRVVQVASLTAGCMVFGIVNGLPEFERREMIAQMLGRYGWERFANW